MYSWEKPGTRSARSDGIWVLGLSAKRSAARRTISLAISMARCSWNSMCVAPSILVLREVVMTSVWKDWDRATTACMMHWISTTIASTAPVRMASSCCRKLPASGTPWRMSVSFAVQQMPARLMPAAPFSCAYLMTSGSWAAATIISERVGSWPWMMMLTSSSLRTPKLAWDITGLGVPNRMSDRSVASMEPPHPSPNAVRSAWSKICSASWSLPMWVRCRVSTTSRSTLRGAIPSSCHICCRFSGARFK